MAKEIQDSDDDFWFIVKKSYVNMFNNFFWVDSHYIECSCSENVSEHIIILLRTVLFDQFHL